MARVKVRVEGSIEKSLRQFKKRCIDAGVFKEIKRSSHYEKPSEGRRRDLLKREKSIRQAQESPVKKRKKKPDARRGGKGGRPTAARGATAERSAAAS